MELNIKTASSSLTFIAYFPSKSVETPNLLPLIVTLTPGSGYLSDLEVTVPAIILSCVYPCWLKAENKKKKK